MNEIYEQLGFKLNWFKSGNFRGISPCLVIIEKHSLSKAYWIKRDVIIEL